MRRLTSNQKAALKQLSHLYATPDGTPERWDVILRMREPNGKYTHPLKQLEIDGANLLDGVDEFFENRRHISNRERKHTKAKRRYRVGLGVEINNKARSLNQRDHNRSARLSNGM